VFKEFMPIFSQLNRPLQVTTPLGEDTLLVTGFRGSEELSTLFSFELSLIADNSTTIDFSKVVGEEITLKVAASSDSQDAVWRYVNGICANPSN
jgi:type VI secretion system secreted protein VgrG